MKRNSFAGRPRSGGLSLNVFTESELEDIHLATLEVLETHRRVCRGRRGARHLLRRRLRGRSRAPHRARSRRTSSKTPFARPRHVRDLCGRDPKNDIVLEPGRVAFTNFSEGIMVVDPRTGELPRFDQAGHCRHRPAERLPERHGHLRCRGGRPRRAARDRAMHNAEAQFLNTTKPVGSALGRVPNAIAIIEMAAAIVGGTDELSSGRSSSSASAR